MYSTPEGVFFCLDLRNLEENINYYRVKTVNDFGNEGPWIEDMGRNSPKLEKKEKRNETEPALVKKQVS